MKWQDVYAWVDDGDGEWTCKMQIPETGWLYRHTELVTIGGVTHLTSCMVFVPDAGGVRSEVIATIPIDVNVTNH